MEDYSKYNKKPLIPQWLRREMAVFGGMIVESSKVIFVSFLVFGTIFGIINGPAVFNNIKWWWYSNYVEDHSGRWWGLKLPETADTAVPDNMLFVPKIGVQAPIMYANTNAPAEINKLLLEGVVHYPKTAMPGEKGNVFITGHSSYYWWSKGKYNTVFSILDKVVVGDVVYVNYGGTRYTYKISNVKVVSPDNLSVLAQGDDYTLTLMTCTPVGTSYKRLIVTANQINPAPQQKKESKSFFNLPGIFDKL